MTSSYHKSTENGYRFSETAQQKRYSSDIYDSNKSSSFKMANTTQENDIKRVEDSAASKHTTLPATDLLFNRDEIVLSYPEKVIPIKEPVISLDIEEDEERIMQADWGNESDDDDNNSIMEKQNKRLSTVEREQIEKEDIESKGIWIMHTADNGRPYYYNSITLQSVWEIPKTTNITSATTATASSTTTAATTNTITTVTPTTYATNITATATAAAAAAAVVNNNSATASTARILDAQSNGKVAINTPSTNKKFSDTNKNGMSNRHSAKDQVKLKAEMQKAEPTPTNTNKAKVEPTSSTPKNTNMTSNMRSSRSNSNSRPTPRDKRSRLSSSQCISRSGYTRRSRSRSRSPLPPPPRDHYYDDYRYYHRSPSPPPLHLYQRRYPSYDRYDSYHPYNDRSRHSPPSPDIRYRYYDPSPPPSSSSSPYYRPRERSWNRYEAYRSRFYR